MRRKYHFVGVFAMLVLFAPRSLEFTSSHSLPNGGTDRYRAQLNATTIVISSCFLSTQLQNLSAEVSTVRRALLRAKEESGTHPLAPTPEESLVQILEESDWPNALTYAKQNK